MAELSDKDKRAILGEGYVTPVLSPERLASDAAARRATLRNTAIGLGVMALVVAAAVMLGAGR